MKSKNTSEISAFLEDLQKRLSAVTKAVKNSSTIESDAAQFEKVIAEMGEPNYRDEEKFDHLAAVQRRLKSCQAAMESQKEKTGEAVAELAKLVGHGGSLACSVLTEVLNNRYETITNCLLPFCVDRERAEQLARQTAAFILAENAVAGYGRYDQFIRKYIGMRRGHPEDYATYAERELSNVLDAAQRIERVLVEATSRAPDLMQFLPLKPTPDKEEAEEAAGLAMARAKKYALDRREAFDPAQDGSSVEETEAGNAEG